jgi:hypothetical protein
MLRRGIFKTMWRCFAKKSVGDFAKNFAMRSEPSPSITHTSTSIYFCRRNQPTEIRYDKIEN